MEPFAANISYKQNRVGVLEQFTDPDVRMSMEADLELIGQLEKQRSKLELYITKNAKSHDPQALYRLQSIPGIGPILSLVILYEIENIDRFPRVQDFASYARLVKCSRESAGKRSGTGGSKIGNAHLKWAFSEAAVLFLKGNCHFPQTFPTHIHNLSPPPWGQLMFITKLQTMHYDFSHFSF